MENFNIINMNKLTWHLNVAILGGVFSVFALLYNDYFIFYGFVTFAFGIFSHGLIKFSEYIFLEKKDNKKTSWIPYFLNILLTIGWITIILIIY